MCGLCAACVRPVCGLCVGVICEVGSLYDSYFTPGTCDGVQYGPINGASRGHGNGNGHGSTVSETTNRSTPANLLPAGGGIELDAGYPKAPESRSKRVY